MPMLVAWATSVRLLAIRRRRRSASPPARAFQRQRARRGRLFVVGGNVVLHQHWHAGGRLIDRGLGVVELARDRECFGIKLAYAVSLGPSRSLASMRPR
jgi:hypothetical protein